MDRTAIAVNQIYSNLLLIAISRNRDFGKLVTMAEKETCTFIGNSNHEDSSLIPRGYDGLYFTELLASKIGSSLGEAYNLSERQKEEIIWSIIQKFCSDDAFFYYYTEIDDIRDLYGEFEIPDDSDEAAMRRYYSDDDAEENSIVTSYYIIFRCNHYNDEKSYYSILISDNDKDCPSNYIHDELEVWTGTDGCIANYIHTTMIEYEGSLEKLQKDISKEDNNSGPIKENTSRVDEEVMSVNDTVEEKSKPVHTESKIVDELIVSVYDGTKTVDLLDKFEGINSTDSTKYRRIVIQNIKYCRRTKPDYRVIGFNLVIERGRGSDYVGNLTFTEFKKGHDAALRKYLDAEITQDIINRYIDKDQYYRFSKPFLLRAQNSSNRTGYGWVWDWSGGYGDYIEGTQYGETTNYFFVGTYITTSYFYIASKRMPYEELNSISLANEVSGSDNVVLYEGKLRETNPGIMERKFFAIQTPSGIKYIPASFYAKTKTYYINSKNGNKYGEEIKKRRYQILDNIP